VEDGGRKLTASSRSCAPGISCNARLYPALFLSMVRYLGSDGFVRMAVRDRSSVSTARGWGESRLVQRRICSSLDLSFICVGILMFGCWIDKAAVFAGFRDMWDDDDDAVVVEVVGGGLAMNVSFDFVLEVVLVLMPLAPKREDELWKRCAAACPARIDAADLGLGP